ncbi:MAG: ethanolamine ammonia-lyase subunit EutC [Tannerella sp.]|jgi:ethanolamine ammonia-lyase small subunit|nr:ethanolamine ammonia-lyase subunit EutC [Tannerella sp.]
MAKNVLTYNPWGGLKQYTAARIALGRAGAGLPTDAWLGFKLSHAQAKDAVWLPFEKERIAEALRNAGLASLNVASMAANRQEYLTRPDLGKRLNTQSITTLRNAGAKKADVLLVIGDGLSSTAMHAHAVPFVRCFMPYLDDLNKTAYPIVIAENARVALGDEIAQMLDAEIVVMLIGERPGLTSPDSMGIYLSWKPTSGCPDSERNCISNIRPEGLTYDRAAFKLAWLIENAFAIRRTGIELKDLSDDPQYHRLVQPRFIKHSPILQDINN